MDEDDKVDYQLGAADVNTDSVDKDGEFVPFQMESRALFSTLAEDIYSSPKAGIRESLSNAITATMRAIDNYDISKDEAVIEIKIDETLENPKLIIEDNGDGMTINKIREVVSYIGRSTVRDDYEKVGQFGMGFLAIFSLCGTNGGFVMHTHSRKTDESISGIWKDGGFSSYANPTKYAKEMEGTRLEIFLKDTISVDDVHSWIEEIAEWSRIPVLYERVKETGVYSDEFGLKDLKSLINTDKPHVIVETDYYEVICCNNMFDTPTILLDVPINRPIDNIPHAPFESVAIRFKTEHPIVTSGEYEGKMVASDVEYSNMDEKRKKNYVSEKMVSEHTPVTPAPTGARETLTESPEFWSDVGMRLKEEYNRKLSLIIDTLSTDGFKNITKSQWELLRGNIPSYTDSYRQFISVMNSKFDNLSEETLEKLYAASNNILVSKKRESYTPRLKKSFIETNIGGLLTEDPEYVFMFIGHVNQEKSARILKSEADSRFVKVDNSEWYKFYSNVFGWEELSDVTEDHKICSSIDEDDVLQENYIDSMENKSTDKKFVVHTGNPSSRYKRTYNQICDAVSTDDNQYILELENKSIEELIVFSSSSSGYNLSDYTFMKSNKKALINVSDKYIDDILELPVSKKIDTYIKSANSYELITSDGFKRFGKIPITDSLIHVVPDDLYEFISQDIHRCTKMKKLLSNQEFHNVESPTNRDLYAVVPISDIDEIIPLLKNSIVLKSSLKNVNIDTISGPKPAQCRLYINSFSNRNIDIIKIIDKKICSSGTSDDSIKSVVSLFNEISDNSSIELSDIGDKYE